MTRFLPFLLVASLVVIATAAFAEEQDDTEVAESSTLTESLPEPVPDSDGKRSKKRKESKRKEKKSKRMKRKGKKTKGNKSKGKETKGNRKKNRKEGKKNRGKGGMQGVKRCAKAVSRAGEASCSANVVTCLQYEGSVITNFLSQKIRATGFKKIVKNKKEKKANFANATDHMLDALGGNSSAPVCSMSSLRLFERSADEAIANYQTLKNCSADIESNCAMANGTLDEDALNACNETFFAIKKKNAMCCLAPAADKCACFKNAAALVAAAKNTTCKVMGIAANKAMKTAKTKCTKSFAACNKAEASTSGFINVCLGEENSNANSTATTALGSTGSINYNKKVNFTHSAHGAYGYALLVNSTSFSLTELYYDGAGPKTNWIVGTANKIGVDSSTYIIDSLNADGTLKYADAADVTDSTGAPSLKGMTKAEYMLKLPVVGGKQLVMTDIKWIALYCRKVAMLFMDVRIPEGFQ